MSPQNGFHLRSAVVAVFELHYFWRSAAGIGQVEEIRVRGYNREVVCHRIFPDLLVGREAGEAGIEDMYRTGKEICEPVDKFRRQIGVEEKL